MSRKRAGFTLVELLVVIAIIGVLVGLLLPAVQAAREAAGRMQCTNNLRQLGLGMHNFHAAHDYFPGAVSGSVNGVTVTHYWGAQILPYMEQNPLADMYDYTRRFSDIENKAAVQYPLTFMQCPSTPGTPLPDPKFKTGADGWGSYGSDYAGSNGPSANLWNSPAYISYPIPGNTEGFFKGTSSPGKKGRGLRDITDGSSNSIMFVEAAGRPQLWQKRKLVPESGLVSSPAARYVSLSSWAHANQSVIRGYRYDESVADEHASWKSPGGCMVNCSNNFSIYSFHSGAANVAFADGSVHTISEGLSIDTVAKLLTVQGGEVVGEF